MEIFSRSYHTSLYEVENQHMEGFDLVHLHASETFSFSDQEIIRSIYFLRKIPIITNVNVTTPGLSSITQSIHLI